MKKIIRSTDLLARYSHQIRVIPPEEVRAMTAAFKARIRPKLIALRAAKYPRR